MITKCLRLASVLLLVAIGIACSITGASPKSGETLTADGSALPSPTFPAASTPMAEQTPTTTPKPTPTLEGNAPQVTSGSPDTGGTTPLTSTPAAKDSIDERPLEELSAEASRYLASRTGPIGVAVVVPSQGAIYSSNGDEPFHMGSVAKVPIMLAVMDKAIQQSRSLTDHEIALLEAMITVSDNASADALWHEVGGAEGVGAYLRSIGLSAIDLNPDIYWGASYAPANEVALLLAKLAEGEILDESSRALALDLMSRVDPRQTWGVAAGIPAERLEDTLIGIKNGWYLAYDGWWVNSAGVVLSGTNKPTYTIVVFTAGQPSLAYGIETIEGLAEIVHSELGR